jgi:thioredoxin 1
MWTCGFATIPLKAPASRVSRGKIRPVHRVERPEVPMSNVKQVSDGTFEVEVLNSETPVLIDFFAEWCGPCKMMAPVLDEVARDYAGKLKVVKVDVDESGETAARFGVTAMPTFVLVKNGREAFRRVGAAPKSTFVRELQQAI